MSNNYIFKYRFPFFHINLDIFQTRNLLVSYNTHKFHVLNASILPFLISFFVAAFLMGQVFWWHSSFNLNLVFINKLQIHISFVGLMYTSLYWGLSIIKESSEGHHTYEVQKGLILGFYIFLITEIMLFFSFFWAYFWLSINPSISLGNVWPPQKTQIKCPWGLPLFNTIILLLSGYTITLAHRTIVNNRFNFDICIRKLFLKFLILTIILGIIFLMCQKWEYTYGLRYVWSTNAFWSCFFLLTGFHGFHVLIGTLFLIFNALRVYFARNYLFEKNIYFFLQKLHNFRYNLYMYFRKKLLIISFFSHYRKTVQKLGVEGIVFNYNLIVKLQNLSKKKINADLISKITQLLKKQTVKHYYFTKNVPWKSSELLRKIIKKNENSNSLFLTIFPVNFFDWSKYGFSSQQHIGFETALFYWHFVDIVWIFLFLSVYVWGF